MAGKGGARLGAGRPSNAVKYEDQIKSLNDAIARDVEEIYAKGLELVKGVQVQKIVRGKPIIYSEPPCAKMIIFFLEKLAGKPVQQLEVSGQDGQSIEINATVRDEASRELQSWRKEMIERLSSLPSVPPTTPTSSTPSE
jgi:hypothetical protein